MKTFKEYLSESKKTYDFRVKIACDVSSELENTIRETLSKFKVVNFKKAGKTPIQELPLDFPKVKNAEVSIYEVTLEYPTTQFELTEVLSVNLKLPKECLAIRRPGEPYEEYQTPTEKRKDTLLNDNDYKEAFNAKFDDYYGEKYNSSFIKEMNKILKDNQKERGEKIPTEGAAKFNTDAPQNTKSPIQQAKDPRKK